MVDSLFPPPPTNTSGDSRCSSSQLSDSSTTEDDSVTSSRYAKHEMISPSALVGSNVPWGKLISLKTGIPDMSLEERSSGILAKGKQQNIYLVTLTRIPPRKRIGPYTALLEVGSGPGIDETVKVNGCVCPPDSSLVLEGDDEFEYGSPEHGYQAYKFQPVCITSESHNSVTSSVQRQKVKDSLQQQILSSDDIEVSFDSFPYYLSENTKQVLIAPAHMHLKRSRFLEYSLGLATVSSRILLSAPAGFEIYQESLTKALAKHFSASLLIIDCLLLPSVMQQGFESSQHESSTSLKLGDRVKVIMKYAELIQRGPYIGYRGKVVAPPVDGDEMRTVGVRFDKVIEGGTNLRGLTEAEHGYKIPECMLCLDNGCDDDTPVIEKLFEVVSSESKRAGQPGLILYFKEIDEFLVANPEAYKILINKFENLPEKVILIGSLAYKEGKLKPETVEELSRLFPNQPALQLSQDEAVFLKFKEKLKQDVEMLIANSNIATIQSVLKGKGLTCDDLEPRCIKDQALTTESAGKIVGWALAYMDMNNCKASMDGAKLVLPNESIMYGLSLLNSDHIEPKNMKRSLKDVVTENEFEKELLAAVVDPADIGITFDGIGALESVKERLRELVMLPLQMPELFGQSQLTKPWRGILLFGPPGTGKTVLAKALATEAGVNFINVSMSSIMSKHFGDREKYIKAVFTLATKISPSIIFLDEADSVLGRRGYDGESEITRRIKNEFLTCWEGLCTKEYERVLVLAATSKPFDLDEAFIRRLPRRLMVSLPDVQNREKILRVILAKENMAADVDFDAIANLTEGYSGSDLKNLCETAAQRPLKEFWEKKKKENGSMLPKDPTVPVIRHLNMEDLKFAHEQVGASFSSDSQIMRELHHWNDLYGEGGSRKKATYTYFV